MKYEAVIVSYGHDIAELCNILIRKKIPIIIIDNKGDLEVPHPNFGLKVIKPKNNLNFSGGCNEGIKHLATETKYVIFINPDIDLTSLDFEKLFEFIEENSHGFDIFGIHIKDEEGNTNHAGVVFDKKGWPCHFLFGTKDHHLARRSKEMEAVSGAFMVVKRKVFEELRFNEVYQNGYEDVDFCLRAKEKGYRILYLGEVEVRHSSYKNKERFQSEAENFFKFHHIWIETNRLGYLQGKKELRKPKFLSIYDNVDPEVLEKGLEINKVLFSQIKEILIEETYYYINDKFIEVLWAYMPETEITFRVRNMDAIKKVLNYPQLQIQLVIDEGPNTIHKQILEQCRLHFITPPEILFYIYDWNFDEIENIIEFSIKENCKLDFRWYADNQLQSIKKFINICWMNSSRIKWENPYYIDDLLNWLRGRIRKECHAPLKIIRIDLEGQVGYCYNILPFAPSITENLSKIWGESPEWLKAMDRYCFKSECFRDDCYLASLYL